MNETFCLGLRNVASRSWATTPSGDVPPVGSGSQRRLAKSVRSVRKLKYKSLSYKEFMGKVLPFVKKSENKVLEDINKEIAEHVMSDIDLAVSELRRQFDRDEILRELEDEEED